MTRNAQLAHHVDVEWSAEPPCDLVADRNASPGQRQHDYARIARIFGQRIGELPAGIGSVREQLHGGSLP
jgi:hypothetical protein